MSLVPPTGFSTAPYLLLLVFFFIVSLVSFIISVVVVSSTNTRAFFTPKRSATQEKFLDSQRGNNIRNEQGLSTAFSFVFCFFEFFSCRLGGHEMDRWKGIV